MIHKTAFDQWLRISRKVQAQPATRMPVIEQSSEGVYRKQGLSSITRWPTSGLDEVFGYALIMYGYRYK